MSKKIEDYYQPSDGNSKGLKFIKTFSFDNLRNEVAEKLGLDPSIMFFDMHESDYSREDGSSKYYFYLTGTKVKGSVSKEAEDNLDEKPEVISFVEVTDPESERLGERFLLWHVVGSTKAHKRR